MTALDNPPDHWESTTIGEVADVKLGRQRSPKNHSGDQMRPYLRAANVDWYRLRPDDIKKMNFTDEEMETYALEENDILIVEGSGSATEVGKCALVPERFVGHGFQNTLIRVRAGDDVDPRWLMYRINAEAELGGFLAFARGSGIFHLGSRRTGKWPIAVPPLDEQREIVVSLDRMLSRLDKADNERARAQHRLPVLRDAVIHAATSGVVRCQAHGGDARAELQAVNDDLTPKQDKVEPQPSPGWLPDGWAWVTVRTAVGDGGLISDGDWVETKDQDPNGAIRLLQLSDIGRGVFRDRSDRHINGSAAARLGVTDVHAGDVLVARLGDPPGDAIVVPSLGQRAVTAVDVCILRPVDAAVASHWLMWCMNSPRFRSAVVAHQSGTTRKRIARTKLEQLCIPVPPRAQQERLVDWISGEMVRIDRMRRSFDACTTRTLSLRRSILRAAFEGRLIADRPDSESSDDLEDAVA